ncbi:unnamed protein product [Dovyalis caffra]|uniref:Uncharacterized protein n=1 Tax=Dovyalis caffra TaxID=77055 RepID=A0AAV1S6S3_9ROSI|nr:unnamed protein product [Dovyalis caffra]
MFPRQLFLSHVNRESIIKRILSSMGCSPDFIERVTPDISSFASDMVTNPCNASTSKVLTMVLVILVTTPYDEREEIDRALNESLIQETSRFKPASKSCIDGLKRMSFEDSCSMKDCMVARDEPLVPFMPVCHALMIKDYGGDLVSGIITPFITKPTEDLLNAECLLWIVLVTISFHEIFVNLNVGIRDLYLLKWVTSASHSACSVKETQMEHFRNLDALGSIKANILCKGACLGLNTLWDLRRIFVSVSSSKTSSADATGVYVVDKGLMEWNSDISAAEIRLELLVVHMGACRTEITKSPAMKSQDVRRKMDGIEVKYKSATVWEDRFCVTSGHV